jgi:beta-glucosidase
VARVSKLRSVWTEAHKAIRDGAKLAGIFHWSFLDNLEWGSGYSLHFGLVFVGENI